MDGLVVRALRDLDERDGLWVERVGEVHDERAVPAAAVLLADVESERRGLLIAGRGAVAEGVRGVGREGAARLVGLAEDLDVALGHAAVVDGRDVRALR